MSLTLYLFKIAVPPVLVALMSMAARRLGPSMGGLLMGLPWMTGPVTYFLARDRDAAYAVRIATGVELGTVAIAAFALAYAIVSRHGPWSVCLPIAALAFGLAGVTAGQWPLDLIPATALAVVALIFARVLIAAPQQPTPVLTLPWWDIPARMGATFALVACIMLSSERLGPELSGVVSSYPVILTVVGSFTHHQLGRDGVLRVLRGLTMSLVGFALFFLVVGLLAPTYGLGLAYLVGALASLSFSGALMLTARR